MGRWARAGNESSGVRARQRRQERGAESVANMEGLE
jgi:hypothetical protein